MQVKLLYLEQTFSKLCFCIDEGIITKDVSYLLKINILLSHINIYKSVTLSSIEKFITFGYISLKPPNLTQNFVEISISINIIKLF